MGWISTMSSLHSASCLARSGVRHVSANRSAKLAANCSSTSSMVMHQNLARRSGYSGVMPVRTALRPGVLSPTLPVPRSIVPPEYALKPTVDEGSEPWVQTPEVIEKMRVAGRIAAGALAEAGKAVAPGVTTDELDRIAHEYMV